MKALFSKIIPYVTVLLAILACPLQGNTDCLVGTTLDGSYTRYCNSVFRKKMAMANSFR